MHILYFDIIYVNYMEMLNILLYNLDNDILLYTISSQTTVGEFKEIANIPSDDILYYCSKKLNDNKISFDKIITRLGNIIEIHWCQKLLGGSNQINANNLIYLSIISSIFFIISMVVGTNILKKLSTIQNTHKYLTSARIIPMFILVISLVIQHFYIQWGKISENCKMATSMDLLQICIPYLVIIVLLIILHTSVIKIPTKYMTSTNVNMVLIALYLLGVYNVISKSMNYMDTSDPKFPFLFIIFTSFVMMFTYNYLENPHKSYNIFILFLLFLSQFLYNYTINVGGINYLC